MNSIPSFLSRSSQTFQSFFRIVPWSSGKCSLVQWNWFFDVTECTWVSCIQWCQRTNFTAPGCIYKKKKKHLKGFNIIERKNTKIFPCKMFFFCRMEMALVCESERQSGACVFGCLLKFSRPSGTFDILFFFINGWAQSWACKSAYHTKNFTREVAETFG